MTTLSEATKAKRGTKRVCLSCEVRFYDLARSPIVCPACQAVFTPVEQPVVQARVAGKPGWRPTSKRAPPMVPPADLEPSAAAEIEVADDVIEEPADAASESEDAVILEQEDDDGDVSGFIDHDVEAPKEP